MQPSCVPSSPSVGAGALGGVPLGVGRDRLSPSRPPSRRSRGRAPNCVRRTDTPDDGGRSDPRGPRPGQGLPDPRRSAAAAGRRRAAPSPASASRVAPGRDARPGGGVGLRQVDDRPAAAAAARRRRRDRSSSDGVDVLTRPAGARCATLRRRMQIVFQDPYASLNPRMTVQAIIGEPMRIHGMYDERRQRAGQGADGARRAEPRAREPLSRTSSPAVSASASASPGRSRSTPTCSCSTSRSRRSTCRSRPASSTCSRTCRTSSASPTCSSPTTCPSCATSPTRSAVMYLGKIVEIGPADDVYETPGASVHAGAAVGGAGARSAQGAGPRRGSCSQGDVPSPVNPPSGCRFRTRCWKAELEAAGRTPRRASRWSPCSRFARWPIPSPATSRPCSKWSDRATSERASRSERHPAAPTWPPRCDVVQTRGFRRPGHPVPARSSPTGGNSSPGRATSEWRNRQTCELRG